MDALTIDKNMKQKNIMNREEALTKLTELIELSGEKIDYDCEKSEATITTKNGHKVKMKRIGENDCFRYDTFGKNVGIFYGEIEGNDDTCLLMHVVVKEGHNMRIYRFRQGDGGTGEIIMNAGDLFRHDRLPRFDYFEYQNGLLYCFTSDGHFLEIATSNNEMCVVKPILDFYGISDPTPCKNKVNYKEIDFGAHMLGRMRYKGCENLSYIPKVRLEYIKDNNQVERMLLIDHAGATIIQVASTLTHNKRSHSRSQIFPKCYNENERDIGSTSNFRPDDIKCLDYSVEVLQSREAKDAYNTWKDFVSTQPVMAYINNYYGNLIEGLEYYQSGYVNPGEVQRITDVRPRLSESKSTSNPEINSDTAKRLLFAKYY